MGGEFRRDSPGIGLDPRDQSHPERRVGIDDPPREREICGLALADDPGQADSPAPGAEQPQCDARLAEGCRRRPDPEIAGQREFEPAAPGRTVDPRDDGRRRVGDGPGDPLASTGERRGARAVETGNLVEVGARTERLAPSSKIEHRRPLREVADGRLEGGEALARHRVAPIRPIDRDCPHAVVEGRADHPPTASRGRSKGLWLLRRKLPLMDRVVRCRRAARDAVADVEPSQLQAVIAETIDDASMTPAVLTVESAVAADPGADRDAVARPAAGVQLIYEGLALTRRLAREEPWDERREKSDLEILAADILVARGFYVLARTDAAGKAVRTVRAFGHDQTLREEPGADADALDANLERDVAELAVLAGAAAVGVAPTRAQLADAADVARGTAFPPAERCARVLDGGIGASPADERSRGDDPDSEAVPGEGGRADRATSATDP